MDACNLKSRDDCRGVTEWVDDFDASSEEAQIALMVRQHSGANPDSLKRSGATKGSSEKVGVLHCRTFILTILSILHMKITNPYTPGSATGICFV